MPNIIITGENNSQYLKSCFYDKGLINIVFRLVILQYKDYF